MPREMISQNVNCLRQGVLCFQEWGGIDADFTHSIIFDKCVKLRYTHPMKQVISAKLKLYTDPTQFQALRQTQLAYRDALNYVSCYSFEHGKMSSGRALQRATI